MKNLLRYEKYFFLLLVLLHLLPVLLLEFFVTHDGPSHVYNSYIISRLLHGDELTARYFMMNPHLEPNWLGHGILIFFNLFFKGNISERILIALYISMLPLAFRYLILTLNKDGVWISYLIFPFIYSLLFYQGFYNFCIGIPLVFYSLAFLVRSHANLNTRKLLLFSLLGLLMYFSHIFILMMFLPAAFFYVVFENYFSTENKKLFTLNGDFVRKGGALTLALLPCLILSIYFVMTHTEEDDVFRQMNFLEHLEFLFMGRPLITLNYDEEQYQATILAMTCWVILLVTIFQRLKKFVFTLNDCWLVVSILILVAYFFVPDAIASGSFVSHRLLLFFYFFLFIWAGSGHVHETVKLFSAPVFVMLSLFTLIYHYNESKNLDMEAREFVSCSESIEEKSVVLPLNYSTNWLHGNLSNYISAEKNIVMLDNYEAAKPHFPTMWKTKMNPYTAMSFSSFTGPCMEIDGFEKNTGEKIDYIIRWAFHMAVHDSCTDAMSNYINERYTPVFTSLNGRAEVFKRLR